MRAVYRDCHVSIQRGLPPLSAHFDRMPPTSSFSYSHLTRTTHDDIDDPGGFFLSLLAPQVPRYHVGLRRRWSHRPDKPQALAGQPSSINHVCVGTGIPSLLSLLTCAFHSCVPRWLRLYHPLLAQQRFPITRHICPFSRPVHLTLISAQALKREPSRRRQVCSPRPHNPVALSHDDVDGPTGVPFSHSHP
jgi:hypothetical protein